MQAAGKGKLLEVLQHYGDTLWQTLGKAAAPNDGFQQGFVAPTDLVAAAAVEAGDEAAAAADGADTSTAAGAAVTAAGLEQLSLNGSSNGAPTAAAAAAGQPDADSSSSGGPDMDQLLEVSLLQALLKSVKDADLPLSSSSFWSQHIKPCRPVGSELDVKRSSHKKMSKFLQVGGV